MTSPGRLWIVEARLASIVPTFFRSSSALMDEVVTLDSGRLSTCRGRRSKLAMPPLRPRT